MINLSALTGNGVGQTKQTKQQGEIGQEDFLKLMVTQLKNQDPFQPMENGEFLAQIAQFTTATGIQDMQQSFNTFAGSLNSSQALQASALVGKSVSVRSETGYLPADGSLTAAIKTNSPLENLSVGIYTEAGVLVRQLDLGQQAAGEIAVEWDGRNGNGVAQPSGRYVMLATTQVGEEQFQLDTLVNAQVQSVTLGSGGMPPTLSLAGLGDVSLSLVHQIR